MLRLLHPQECLGISSRRILDHLQVSLLLRLLLFVEVAGMVICPMGKEGKAWEELNWSGEGKEWDQMEMEKAGEGKEWAQGEMDGDGEGMEWAEGAMVGGAMVGGA